MVDEWVLWGRVLFELAGGEVLDDEAVAVGVGLEGGGPVEVKLLEEPDTALWAVMRCWWTARRAAAALRASQYAVPLATGKRPRLAQWWWSFASRTCVSFVTGKEWGLCGVRRRRGGGLGGLGDLACALRIGSGGGDAGVAGGSAHDAGVSGDLVRVGGVEQPEGRLGVGRLRG